MMKILKKYAALLPAVVLCLCLTACFDIFDAPDPPDITGDDWRTWGFICDNGTITRDGVDTKVLVCVYENRTDFFYDSKEQVQFGAVNYPITLLLAWDKLRGIDFADLNGDGNSDVTITFNDRGSEVVMVLFWDTESEQFGFRTEESQLSVPVLMGGELPFADMENLQSETYEDATYYCKDATEDGRIMVVNTVRQGNYMCDFQTLGDYLSSCAMSLGGGIPLGLQSMWEDADFSEQMGYTVYIVKYTADKNDDPREWTVFAMDTDRHTYLYGIGATPDAAEEVNSVWPDIFAGLYLSDAE